MEFVNKAIFDSVAGAPFARQDLSSVITLQDGEPRPVSSMAPQVEAKQEIHQWREAKTFAAGSGQESYAEGALPNTPGQNTVSMQNTTCRVGYTAQVTEEMMAVWRHGGVWMLDNAQTTRVIQEALDFEVALATEAALNGIEYQHESGDSSNPQGTNVWPGGQTDGLLKWCIANGSATYASGSSSGPVTQMSEQIIKNAARTAARRYPRKQPDTLLMSTGLREDFSSFVGSGAGRAILQVVKDGPNGTAGLVGGSEVAYYNTGYSVLKLETAPYFSALRNQNLPGNGDAIVLYNKSDVKHAQLIPLSTTPLAQIDTSLKTIVRSSFAQEHRNVLGAQAILNVASAFTG